MRKCAASAAKHSHSFPLHTARSPVILTNVILRRFTVISTGGPQDRSGEICLLVISLVEKSVSIQHCNFKAVRSGKPLMRCHDIQFPTKVLRVQIFLLLF